jgi:hypothetical protein
MILLPAHRFPGNPGRQETNDASDVYLTTGPLDGPRAINLEFMMLLGWHRLNDPRPIVVLRYRGDAITRYPVPVVAR